MVTFRDATEADVPALVALVQSAYRGEASRAGWTTEADLLDGQRTDPETMRETLRTPGSVLLTVERDRALVACCHITHQAAAETGGSASFGLFAVSPRLQGEGLGKAVLAEAERRAVLEWDVEEMRMQVISVRRDIIAWYERRGYLRSGRTSPFPYGDERFGLPRRSDLAFELLVKTLR